MSGRKSVQFADEANRRAYHHVSPEERRVETPALAGVWRDDDLGRRQADNSDILHTTEYGGRQANEVGHPDGRRLGETGQSGRQTINDAGLSDGRRSDNASVPGVRRAWQEPLNSCGKALEFLLETGTLSDITFLVGPEARTFRAHRLLLATRSPVMEELLVSDPRYSSCDDVIPLRRDNPVAFHWIMQHIYTDRTDLQDMEMALNVLGLAEKYMIASAYDCCIRYLVRTVRRSTVLLLYRHLVDSGADCAPSVLYSMCRKVFVQNGNSVLMSSALHKLTPAALAALLREPLRVTSEVVVFKAVVSWGYAQLKSKGIPASRSALRREVEAFLPELRLFTMSTDEFIENVVITDVLTPEEVVIVLKHIARPEANLSTADLLDEGIKLCASREKRPALIRKDEPPHTVQCVGVVREWLRRPCFQFHLTASDNIVLLSFKLTLRGTHPVKIDVFKDDALDVTLASAVSNGEGTAKFHNPLHIRESVSYLVKITTAVRSQSKVVARSQNTSVNDSKESFHSTRFAGDNSRGLTMSETPMFSGVGITNSEFTVSEETVLLYGADHNAATYTEAGFTITLAPAVFVETIVFL